MNKIDQKSMNWLNYVCGAINKIKICGNLNYSGFFFYSHPFTCKCNCKV